ncbi:MAG: hypothetical protein ACREOZ_04460, partial [Gloeomargaritales cyanobacterium]
MGATGTFQDTTKVSGRCSQTQEKTQTDRLRRGILPGTMRGRVFVRLGRTFPESPRILQPSSSPQAWSVWPKTGGEI